MNPHPSFLISEAPISEPVAQFSGGEGAEVRFLGIVRGIEDGREISGIEYSAYLPMAERLFGELIANRAAHHPEHQVYLRHRLGFVPATQPSILIRVRTRHGAEAFDLCQWYLREIKTKAPIWKMPIFKEPTI